MRRRDVLKTIGVGSAMLPALVATRARASSSERHSTVVAISKLLVGGTEHRIALEGRVVFDTEEGEVQGGGSFAHFIQAGPGVPATGPRPLVAAGRWKAREFLDFKDGFGTFGRIEAGILTLNVRLLPDGGSPAAARLTLICNIGAAGISTDQPEGFRLKTALGEFTPFGVGLTHISTPDGD